LIILVFFDTFILSLLFEIYGKNIEILFLLLIINIPLSMLFVLVGTPVLVSSGYIKEFNKSLRYAAIFLFFALLCIYMFRENLNSNQNYLLYIFAFTLIITNSLILGLRLYYIKKFNLLEG
jgi:hypothetical protein